MIYKIWLIAKREFLTRVKKKSFLVMTLLSPLLIMVFYGFIIYFSINKELAEDNKTIIISDHTGVFADKITDSKTLHFTYQTINEEQIKNTLENSGSFGILVVNGTEENPVCELFTREQPSLGTTSTLENKLEQVVRNHKLKSKGIDQQLLDDINKSRINLATRMLTDKGYEDGNSGITTVIGFLGAILIYFFIFLYGVQVMRGVIEEKTNRIVEVIISSVKPFELMMGKITGIALVGLTQFLIWVILVATLSTGVSGLIMKVMHVGPEMIQQTQAGMQQASSPAAADLFKGLNNLNIPLLLGLFLFYFISGYLFYGALFAAIGSAVDSETDTQQFMFPVTMPLVFSFVLAQTIVTNDPNSSLSVWLSMIPFSSPVIMMVRAPFGIPPIQIIGSIVCMIAGFIFTVWLAGRIYRIGILTYGRKPTYKELFKWLFRKN